MTVEAVIEGAVRVDPALTVEATVRVLPNVAAPFTVNVGPVTYTVAAEGVVQVVVDGTLPTVS